MIRTEGPVLPDIGEILSPKVDIIFKMLFGSEKNKNITIDFLQSVLGETNDKIEEISILNPYTKQEYKGDKLGILDIKLALGSGAVVGIEIQLVNTHEIKERAEFYLSKMYAEALASGDDYRNLQKSIVILITNFVLFEETDDYFNSFFRISPKTGIRFSNKTEIYTIELPKIKMLAECDNTPLYSWAKFIASEQKEDFEMLAKQNTVLEAAYKELKRLSLDHENRELYEARLKAIRDEVSRVNAGKREGLAEGKEIGIAEGKEMKSFEVARNLLKKGLAPELIAEATELSLDVVLALADSSAPDQ